MLTIAVVLHRIEEFDRAASFITGPMEKAHDIKFLKNHADNSYQAPGYKIIPALNLIDVWGLKNYQLVKYGEYAYNPDLKKIEQHWESVLEK